MKKIFLLTLVLLISVLITKAQWNQSFTGVKSCRSVSVANDNVVWISDPTSATFSYTINGGFSWITKELPLPITSKHGVLWGVNASTAYIVANPGGSANGIYKTTDGGSTWNKQTTGFNQNSPFPDFVYFWNENEGVAVGDASPNPNFEIYTTTDGGSQWVPVPSSNMPPGNKEWTFSDISSSFRVNGNSIYFRTSGSGSVSRIFKSIDKGKNWSVISVPTMVTNFDFRDENNGLLTKYGKNGIDTLFSTTDGGLHWAKINLVPLGTINYIPNVNAYFKTSYSTGLSYSTDNGQTWINHPSFTNVILAGVGKAPSGKIFIGGNYYVFTSTDYNGVNLSVKQAQITGPTTIDITFSDNVDLLSAQDTANYVVNYIPGKAFQKITIVSATLDNSSNSLVHLVTGNTLPLDTIRIAVKNVTDLNGFPVINGSAVASATSIYTANNNLSGSEINIFPNPVCDKLSITNIPQKSTLSVFDNFGKMLINKKAVKINEMLDVRSLPNGVYTLKIENQKGILNILFVKQ